MINRNIAALSLPVLAAMLTGCSTDRAGSREADAAPLPSANGDVHGLPQQRDMQDVMQAKLAHAQAVLEGLALGDFAQIEANARELRAISQRAEWMVHDTQTYYIFSEQFRQITADLAASARAERLEASTADYVRMLNTCIGCHSYLRREQLGGGMPGRVSRIDAAAQRSTPAFVP